MDTPAALTGEELSAVEYALRKIPDREKSDAGLSLALAVRAETRRRAGLPAGQTIGEFLLWNVAVPERTRREH